MDDTLLSQIRYDERGLVPCITQDADSGTVLMLAYMNEEALRKTIETRRVTYYSRSRQTLWVKGETSGHIQNLRSLHYDCDGDTLLARVEQIGPACHTGAPSCFFRAIIGDDAIPSPAADAIARDYATIRERIAQPRPDSYTNYLLDKGIDTICKKVGEEATEVVIAAKNAVRDELIYESADLIYHLLVLLAQQNIAPDDVFAEMDRRRS